MSVARVALLAAIYLGPTAVALKAYDLYLTATYPPIVPDVDAASPTMRMGEVYPYTGTHMQPFKHEQGAGVLWPNGDAGYNVQSGEYGFFVDFRLEDPPPKAPNEIRIILTGGSTAQGWGGRTNAEMFYKLLPDRLSAQLAANGLACKVSVVNLAMGATVIYQNFIALNKWGHELAPDAIVSFSGHNEIAVPMQTKSDDNGDGANAAAAQSMLRYSSSPAWLKALAQFFPGIVRRTGFGILVRSQYFEQYRDDWKAAYIVSRNSPHAGPSSPQEQRAEAKAISDGMTTAKVIETISVPMYAHSLESIGRDFPRIPVFAAFQPLGHPHADYESMRERVLQRVSAEDPGRIQFLDLAAEWQRNNFFPGSMIDAVHLSNAGHVLVADYLANYLLPFARQRCGTIGR